MKVLFIGTGGLFWAGLPQMVTWLYRRGANEIVLIDPDIVEPENLTRQWATPQVGKEKCHSGYDILTDIGGQTSVTALAVRSDYDRLLSVIKGLAPAPSEEMFVFCCPDNHTCRVETHKACHDMAQMRGCVIYEVIAGNTVDNGFAFGCIHTADGSTIGDWGRRHRNIFVEAGLESYHLTHPQACGTLSGDDEPEQSSESNDLTSYCMWTLAEKLARHMWTGEIVWHKQEQKTLILEKANDFQSTEESRKGNAQEISKVLETTIAGFAKH
jgi:hypothetical protein